MRRSALSVLLGAVAVLIPGAASATYSPPLTRVRIDADRVLHTPSVVYASERKTTAATDVELSGWGAQYLGQFEFDFGFGLQAGAAAGYAGVDGVIGRRAFGGLDVDHGRLLARGTAARLSDAVAVDRDGRACAALRDHRVREPAGAVLLDHRHGGRGRRCRAFGSSR